MIGVSSPRILPAVFLGALLLAAGCSRGQRTALDDPLMNVFRRQEQEEGLNREQTLGKRLFANYCVTCHGDKGEGEGQNAYNLDPMPPNFAETLKNHPPSYWKKIIEGGTAAVGRSPLCPPWGLELSGSQVDAIISYMQVLAKPPSGSEAAGSDSSQAE